MTSIASGYRQISADSSHFISIAPLITLTAATGYASTTYIWTTPFGAPAPWASTGAMAAAGGQYASTLTTAGAILRDMGTRIISSGAYFRKVQLVVPQGSGYILNNIVGGALINTTANTNIATTGGTTSTFGVAGPVFGNAASSGIASPDYLTGYIKLGFEGAGVAAPVAKFGR